MAALLMKNKCARVHAEKKLKVQKSFLGYDGLSHACSTAHGMHTACYGCVSGCV